MGRTHALTGWCTGLAIAPVIGAGTVHQAAAFAATTAGFALLPDLDHPGAGASKLLGPVTGGLSWLLRRTSAAVYQVTKGPRDERVKGTHRHLSHTVLFAAAMGALATWGSRAGGWYAVAGIVLFGMVLAADALGDWLLFVGGGAVVWWATTTSAAGELQQLTGWVGLAVALGCVTHCLGDSLTVAGCPFLFPVPIAGETWYELRPPSFLRFRTGKRAENLVVFPVCAVLGVLLVPGVWEWLVSLVSHPAVQAGN
ncbi:metal-dependent hydrolase [Amycolatopsis cynarae]|uniref:Metal-dependent hydrolase n=2 Tax=Amycolatopsis TaxID=1813 RepID=A0A558CPA4_9PSEU|nr:MULTISPECIES: metal-dependent hydrolase [Amycolatopsis]TVT50599.1 metal-dependent hydrolase [Amycolatopsis rhizosphaerae]WAL69912.1 metal-dependent hydrolase [Amycolatopsis sp. HUAS 11-8]